MNNQTKEIDEISEKHNLLGRIYDRLCFHCGVIENEKSSRRERFITSLLVYPDDLICAAYRYLLAHTTPAHLPCEDDFILFMAPEFNRRMKEERGLL